MDESRIITKKKTDKGKSENRSPFKFFLIVFGLSIPLGAIDAMIGAKRLPLDFSIIDILAAFTPFIAGGVLIYKEEGSIGIAKL